MWLPHLVCTLTSGFYFPLPILLTSPTSTEPDWSFLLPTASPPIDYFPFISSGRFCQPGLQGGQALFKSQSTMSWSHHFPSLSFPVAQQGNNGIYLAGLSGGLHAHCMQRISAQMPSVGPDLRALHYRASTPSFLIVPTITRSLGQSAVQGRAHGTTGCFFQPAGAQNALHSSSATR